MVATCECHCASARTAVEINLTRPPENSQQMADPSHLSPAGDLYTLDMRMRGTASCVRHETSHTGRRYVYLTIACCVVC